MADNSKGATGSSGATSLPQISSGPDGHGAVGEREQRFTSILPPNHPGYDPRRLAVTAELMIGPFDTVKDGPDPEENLWVPAGYTYFGQFVDHDLTFDSTSTLIIGDGSRLPFGGSPTNLRTPRFDLDCVYGDGPDAQPFMYETDGATLLLEHDGKSPNAKIDLARAANGLAIIGDKRNDENSIVSQSQQGFIRFHNAVVAILEAKGQAAWTDKTSLFRSARNEVRWTYQKLVVEDFLPRIVCHEVLADLAGKSKLQRADSYALYTIDRRENLPREFVAAAYRFGHSGVRTGYRLNREKRLPIFLGTKDHADSDSLLGFEPLEESHVIDDWGRFFPNTPPDVLPSEGRSTAADKVERTESRLQLAYKIDATIVDPLSILPPGVAGADATAQAIKAIAPNTLPDKGGRPSLALLNLLRGNAYGLHGGQEYVRLLQKRFPHVKPLAEKHLVIRTATKTDGEYRFTPIDRAFSNDTPLWLYILAEAQMPVVNFITPKLKPDGTFMDDLLLSGDGAKTQLRWVGGRIVAEVFYGLLDSDGDSYVNKAPVGWSPMIGALRVKNLLEFRGIPPTTS